jgi:hypothetical protein
MRGQASFTRVLSSVQGCNAGGPRRNAAGNQQTLNMNYHSVIESKGVRATTLAETLVAADLNFKILEDEVVGAKSGAVMPRKKLLYRSDNKEALGVVGTDYCPTEPKEFIETQFEFAREVGGKVVRAGWVGRRSKAFAIVKMDTIELPCGTKAKDPINLYIYSTDSWDGGSPRTSMAYFERLACLNGMMTRELSTALRVSHTKNATERFDLKVKPFLAGRGPQEVQGIDCDEDEHAGDGEVFGTPAPRQRRADRIEAQGTA